MAQVGQKNDLAAEQPGAVAELRNAYDGWRESLEPVFPKMVRIGLGGQEDPSRLMSHDWHKGTGGTPWHQNHVRNGAVCTGFWAVNVEAAGRYQITLTRWPHYLERAMETEQAEVTLTFRGGTVVDLATDTDPRDIAATLTVDLPAGPAQLSTLLRRTDGEEHGAYYAAVQRM
jgi:hypothetical protein